MYYAILDGETFLRALLALRMVGNSEILSSIPSRIVDYAKIFSVEYKASVDVAIRLGVQVLKRSGLDIEWVV